MTIKSALFVESWWVILFILICYSCFEHALAKKEQNYSLLQKNYHELLQKKEAVKKIQEELIVQMQSQKDLASIELNLMKELGLVPENQTKVVFKSFETSVR